MRRRAAEPADPVDLGKCLRLPERGGHSISNVLLANFVRSKSASKAKPCTVLPLFCRTGLSGSERSLRGEAGLLAEFAERAGQQIVRPHQPLRDGPGAVVLARPERPARMRQQEFEFVPPPVGEEACADFVACVPCAEYSRRAADRAALRFDAIAAMR